MKNTRNFSHTSNFIFQTNLFSEDTIFTIQACNLPGISFNHIEVGKSAVLGNIQGDTITYDTLDINIIIDEKLNAYREIIDMLQTMREPTKSTSKMISKYGYLTIQDDNSNSVLKVEFKNMIVESIGGLDFSTNNEDSIITCPISIKYDYYTILK